MNPTYDAKTIPLVYNGGSVPFTFKWCQRTWVCPDSQPMQDIHEFDRHIMHHFGLRMTTMIIHPEPWKYLLQNAEGKEIVQKTELFLPSFRFDPSEKLACALGNYFGILAIILDKRIDDRIALFAGPSSCTFIDQPLTLVGGIIIVEENAIESIPF